jgi:hypothetical protein
VSRAYGMHVRGKKSVLGFGVKAQRKDTTQKTKTLMGGWDQNGSLGGCVVDSPGSR